MSRAHSGPTHPEHGGRVLLERQREDDDQVSYDLTLFTADAAWTSLVRVSKREWRLELGAWRPGTSGAAEGPEPPKWLVLTAEAFLRSLWRARQGDDPPAWPRRLSRWREPKA